MTPAGKERKLWRGEKLSLHPPSSSSIFCLSIFPVSALVSRDAPHRPEPSKSGLLCPYQTLLQVIAPTSKRPHLEKGVLLAAVDDPMKTDNRWMDNYLNDKADARFGRCYFLYFLYHPQLCPRVIKMM